jgi:protein-tyrosine phosphatase
MTLETCSKHRILFICLGNICRSPAAEGIMKHIVNEAGMTDMFYIDSAGMGNWHVGSLPDRRMRDHGRRHGYTFDSRARQFTRSDFARFDLIVTMDESNRRGVMAMANSQEERDKVVNMADYLTLHHGQATVPDPYYGGDSDFELVIELLEDACQGLYNSIMEKGDRR